MSMKKIAEATGVSVSTVSLVLSGKGRISNAVKNSVLQAAKDIGYKSPLYQEDNKKVVALLYPIDVEWRHVLAFINGILIKMEEVFRLENLTTVLIPISFNEAKESVNKKLQDLLPLAVCSIHYINEELFEMLECRNVPVVIVNRSLLQDKFSTVCVDDFQGAYEGGKYLIERTRTSEVAFLGYEKGSMTGVIDDRAYGFQKALLEDGCRDVQDAIHYAREPLDQGVLDVLKKFTETQVPRAFYVYDDYLAIYLIKALDHIGLGVPKDVMVLAPGDTLDYSLPYTPQISTMSIDTVMLGELGAKMVVGKINKVREERQVEKIRQNLIVRDTC